MLLLSSHLGKLAGLIEAADNGINGSHTDNPETTDRKPVILITHADHGLGKAVAMALIGCDVKVIIHGDRQKTEALMMVFTKLREAGALVELIIGDIADPTESRFLCQQAFMYWGALDILIANPGTCKTPEAGMKGLDDVSRVTMNVLNLMTSRMESGLNSVVIVSPPRANEKEWDNTYYATEELMEFTDDIRDTFKSAASINMVEPVSGLPSEPYVASAVEIILFMALNRDVHGQILFARWDQECEGQI